MLYSVIVNYNCNAASISRQSRGPYFVSRSKRLCGVANAVCQLFCVNDQVLFWGMGCRGRG